MNAYSAPAARPAIFGMLAFGLLIAAYFGALTLVTLASRYQVEFFWVGLAFNVGGIIFIANKLLKVTKEHAKCAHA